MLTHLTVLLDAIGYSYSLMSSNSLCWFVISITSVICSLLLSCFIFQLYFKGVKFNKVHISQIRKWRVKKGVDTTLAVQTEAGTSHQELFAHTLFVLGITLWKGCLRGFGRARKVIWDDLKRRWILVHLQWILKAKNLIFLFCILGISLPSIARNYYNV